MNFRKSVMMGLAILAMAGGWLAGTRAQEKSSSPAVAYFDHEKVAGAFARNAALFGGESGNAKYKVLTARRDKPGEVEIHNLDTDIIYVLSVTATFLTGGTPVRSEERRVGKEC